MSAPLHSRFKRQFEKQHRWFPNHTQQAMKNALLRFKNKATVFSLTDRAATEAGDWAMSDPKDLLEALDDIYLPAEYTWIEWSPKAYYNHNGTMMAGWTRENPVRSAVMLTYMQNITHKKVDVGHKDPCALFFHAYPTGFCQAIPVVGGLFSTEEGDDSIPPYGLGRAYNQLYTLEHPRLMKQLRLRTTLVVPEEMVPPARFRAGGRGGAGGRAMRPPWVR